MRLGERAARDRGLGGATGFAAPPAARARSSPYSAGFSGLCGMAPATAIGPDQLGRELGCRAMAASRSAARRSARGGLSTRAGSALERTGPAHAWLSPTRRARITGLSGNRLRVALHIRFLGAAIFSARGFGHGRRGARDVPALPGVLTRNRAVYNRPAGSRCASGAHAVIRVSRFVEPASRSASYAAPFAAIRSARVRVATIELGVVCFAAAGRTPAASRASSSSLRSSTSMISLRASFNRMDQLVELELQGFGVAVLGVLDQKHHQERHDGGAGVDHELPRVGEAEERPGGRPYDDDEERQPMKA